MSSTLNLDKRVLLACYEVPGHGGANTSAYNLFHYMLEDGIDVHYVNIISPEDHVYYKYVFGENYGNPRELENLNNCVLKKRLFSNEPHKEILEIVDDFKPDIILAVNYIAALLLKIAAPKIPLIFYTSGCTQVQSQLADHSIKDMSSYIKRVKNANKAPKIFHVREEQAVQKANLILSHSDDILTLMRYFYPQYSGKLYDEVIWKAEWIYQDALAYSALSKPFKSREIDVIFIASVWSRVQKNYVLLKKLLPKINNHKVHVVGEVEQEFDFVTYHGIVADRYELFTLMGNSRVVACPSSFDPAPGILFEASALGCNIVGSKNCGNWQIFNKNLLAEPYNLQKFVDCITKGLKRNYKDNINYFLKSDSYKNLLDIISVV